MSFSFRRMEWYSTSTTTTSNLNDANCRNYTAKWRKGSVISDNLIDDLINSTCIIDISFLFNAITRSCYHYRWVSALLNRQTHRYHPFPEYSQPDQRFEEQRSSFYLRVTQDQLSLWCHLGTSFYHCLEKRDRTWSSWQTAEINVLAMAGGV